MRISALTHDFKGFFQKEQYTYLWEERTPDRTPVTFMRPRAVITRPADGDELRARTVAVVGMAWSGFGTVMKVEVSWDNGRSWDQAELGEAQSPYAWTQWRLLWVPSPGTYTLMGKATDSSGNRQPLDPVWNANGNGNNVVHHVRVNVL